MCPGGGRFTERSLSPAAAARHPFAGDDGDGWRLVSGLSGSPAGHGGALAAGVLVLSSARLSTSIGVLARGLRVLLAPAVAPPGPAPYPDPVPPRLPPPRLRPTLNCGRSGPRLPE